MACSLAPPRAPARRRVRWIFSLGAAAAAWGAACDRSPAPAAPGPSAGVRRPTATSRSIQYMAGEPETTLFPEMPRPELTTGAADFLAKDDTVYLAQTERGAIAFPTPILDVHHTVNTVLWDRQVVVTSCMLSGSAAVYGREVDGRALTFAVLGPTYFGNAVLHDKETRSYWLQLTGECFHGPLKGRRLEAIANLEVARWGHVEGRGIEAVLKPAGAMTSYRRTQSELGSTQFGYEMTRNTVRVDHRLKPYERGLAVAWNGSARFYPLEAVKEQSPWNDQVEYAPVLVLLDPVSRAIRLFERAVGDRTLTFEPEGEVLQDRETGTAWTYRGEAVRGPLAGKRLEAPPQTLAYWYSWSAFYPGSGIASAAPN